MLTKDTIEDKVNYLFGIYQTPRLLDEIMKRTAVKQMLDHIYFCVIYAIPNLAYHSLVSNFGPKSSKCDRMMEIKLEMQKKVRTNKA